MLNRFLQDWRAIPQLTPLLIILLAIPAVFYSTTGSMIEIWTINETFTHGFIILPISLWLIWEQRQHLTNVGMRHDLRALVLLLPTLAVWLLAALIDVAVVQQLAMVALIPICVWLILGLPLALALLFPLLYLFFAVPLGQSLIPPMMELTADVTVYLVQQSGVPIFRDGLSFELPSGSWAVVEECSGVRYLIASAALGTIYAYISYRSMSKRAVFIVVSLIVPIVANGLRAYGIVMIGHLSGMKYAVGADHLLYGWVFFGIVIFILFWIGGFWADAPLGSSQGADSTDTANTDAPTAPAVARQTTVVGALVIAAMLAANLGITALKAAKAALPPETVLALPATADDWRRNESLNKTTEETSDNHWEPQLTQPDILATAQYQRAEDAVDLHVAYFHTQRDGAEAVSSQNRLTSPYGGAWKLTASRPHSSGSLTVTESEVSYRDQKVLVWSGYLIGNQFVASPYIAKLYQAKELLQGNQQAAFITLSSPFNAPLDDLRDRLNDAWQALEAPVLREIASIETVN